MIRKRIILVELMKLTMLVLGEMYELPVIKSYKEEKDEG